MNDNKIAQEYANKIKNKLDVESVIRFQNDRIADDEEDILLAVITNNTDNKSKIHELAINLMHKYDYDIYIQPFLLTKSDYKNGRHINMESIKKLF